MQASDVMTRDVVVIGPEASVGEAARLLAEKDVSALPVVDESGKIVGIISEADLVRRTEIGTAKHRPWWLEALTPGVTLAEEFTKSHGRAVSELMSREVVSATEETPLQEIAALLERHRIKRVPIVADDGKLAGIVSRSNLVQAIATAPSQGDVSETDRAARLEILSRLAEQSWTDFGDRNITVSNGEAHIWGLVGSPSERKGLITLAEGVPGITAVRDEMIAAY